MTDDPIPGEPSEEVRCLACNTLLAEGDGREVVKDGVACRSCFGSIKQQFEQAVREQSEDINYPMGMLGGILGGIAGALVWWGFTVVTNISFGLAAIAIGFAVGFGVTRFSGDKRSVGLQTMSAIIAMVSFFSALFLVNRTFLNRFLGEEHPEMAEIPAFPELDLFVEVVKADFGVFEVIFLAIVVYQAWKMAAPVKLPG